MSNQSYRTDELLNELMDSNALWGPLLFLRPKRNEPLGPLRLMLACVLLGGFHGMGANLGLAVVHRVTGHAVLPLYTLPMALTVATFLFCQATLVRAWNRRARFLARQQNWTRDVQAAAAQCRALARQHATRNPTAAQSGAERPLAVEPSTAKLDTAELDTAKLDTAKLDRAELDTAKLDRAELDTAKLDTAKLDTAELDTAELDTAKLD